jgi:hypothetical protein
VKSKASYPALATIFKDAGKFITSSAKKGNNVICNREVWSSPSFGQEPSCQDKSWRQCSDSGPEFDPCASHGKPFAPAPPPLTAAASVLLLPDWY